MSNGNSLLQYSEIVMKMFNSEDEGFEFYNDYAYEKGFSVRKDYCEWDSDHNKRTLRKFVCSCEGFRAEKHLRREIKMRRPRNITRCGCRAKLVIAQDQNTEQWYVKDFIDEHNHPMIEPDLSCFLRSHRRISDEQKAEIVHLQISGIRKHQIMDSMLKRYGGYDKIGFTARDLYNFCHRNKLQTLSAGDAQINSFMLTQIKVLLDKHSSIRICTRLLHCDRNKLRLESYQKPITKEAYLVEHQEEREKHRQDTDVDDLQIISSAAGTRSKGEANTASGTATTRRPRGRPPKTRVDEGSAKFTGVEEGTAKDTGVEGSVKVTGVEQGTVNVTGAATRKRRQPSRRTADTAPRTVLDDFSTESIANRVNKRKKHPGKLLSSPYQPN